MEALVVLEVALGGRRLTLAPEDRAQDPLLGGPKVSLDLRVAEVSPELLAQDETKGLEAERHRVRQGAVEIEEGCTHRRGSLASAWILRKRRRASANLGARSFSRCLHFYSRAALLCVHMSKSARQALILGILRDGPISSQNRIAAELKRGGFSANQATISRDLRELGVLKTAQGYTLPQSSQNGIEFGMTRFAFVYSAAVSGTMVVLRTPPAMASPTAMEIDKGGLEGVLGTIAGDDTVFLAMQDSEAAQRLVDEVHEILRKKRSDP